MLKSINPYTHKILESFEEDSKSQLGEKISLAQKTFLEWKTTSFEERRNIMLGVAGKLKERKEDLAGLASREMGKVLKEAKAEVEKCIWVCEYYADHADQFLKEEYIESDASGSYITYQPLGVVLGVMPWNFPYWQVFRFCAPTIMAGNTVLVKHASNVSQCARAIERIFEDAAPEVKIYQNLQIGSKVVADIIDDKRVKAVSLTGSELAGSKVAERAGKNIMKSLLELGGSDPFIVLEDADIKQAIRTGVKSRMINNGQSCIASKRFIIQESVFDEFVEGFKQGLEKMKFGDPESMESDYSVLAREDLAEELEEQVQESIQKGARLLYGGNREKAHFEPSILIDVKPGMRAYSEELFGPVAVMYKVKNMEEAIDLANDSDFGLGGSVWTGDKKKGKYVAENVHTGAMFVNGLVKSDPRLPFGGVKLSGYGRELSMLGIREFTNIKTIWIK